MDSRTFILRVLSAVTVSLGSVSALAAGAIVDQLAPVFTIQAADGSTVDLAKLRGKTVVLEWTNHDCPFVRKHYESGNIPSLQKEALARGIVWFQVISSAPGTQGHLDGASAQKLNASRGAAPSGTLLDPEGRVGRLYGAQATPHLYVVNPEGVLVYKGAIDSIPSARRDDIAKADNYVKLALADVAAGRKVATANTRAYGCSIKYAD